MSTLALVSLLVLAQGLPRFPGDRPGVAASRGGGGAAPIAPTFALYGDSIAAGACSSTVPGVVLQSAMPGSTVSRNAVSGYTSQQIENCYLGLDPSNCTGYSTACLGAECATVIVEGGVNTLKQPGAVTGVVEALALAPLLDVVDHALARGRRVLWYDTAPFASCSAAVCPELVDPDERARTFNGLKAEACAVRASNPLLKCITLYEDFQGPSFDGQLLPAYACDDDGIHLEQAGTNAWVCKALVALGKACP